MRKNVQNFIQDFNKLAPHKHRYDLFRDFVTISAISIYNAMAKDERYEAEYLEIIGQYEKEEAMQLAKLFADVVMMLDPQPSDVLGEIYMGMGLGNAKTGQYFTPFYMAEVMSEITLGDELSNMTKPFWKLHEPSCGSGVMVLAFAKKLIAKGHNPGEKMWACCIDLDRMAALMCYIQLSLWNIPAIVHVGNSLTNEHRESFATPAHHLGFWDMKLKIDQTQSLLGNVTSAHSDEQALVDDQDSLVVEPQGESQTELQFDFDF